MNREQRAATVEALQEIRSDLATIRQALERYRDSLEAHAARRERRRRLLSRVLPFRRAA